MNGQPRRGRPHREWLDDITDWCGENNIPAMLVFGLGLECLVWLRIWHKPQVKKIACHTGVMVSAGSGNIHVPAHGNCITCLPASYLLVIFYLKCAAYKSTYLLTYLLM